MLDDIVKEAAKAVESNRKLAGLWRGLDGDLIDRWSIPVAGEVATHAEKQAVRRMRSGDIASGWVPHLIRQVVPEDRRREVARHELRVRLETTPGAVDELVRSAWSGTNIVGWSHMLARALRFSDPATARDWLVLAR